MDARRRGDRWTLLEQPDAPPHDPGKKSARQRRSRDLRRGRAGPRGQEAVQGTCPAACKKRWDGGGGGPFALHERSEPSPAGLTSIWRAQPGFNFSAVNRRKTGEFTVFGRYRKVVYRCFSVFFVSNFKISKKFINNRQKNRQKL